MPGIEQQIDDAIQYMKIFCIQWGLFLFNRVTNAWDAGCEWCVKSIRAIEHAHKEDVYVFLTRNTHPVCVKGDWEGLRDNTLLYSPLTHRFTRHNRIQTPPNHRFDIVSMTLDFHETAFDIAPLFHEICWKDQANPSLLEMVLLWSMMEKKGFSLIDIQDMKLNVMDSDANTHSISLRSELAHNPFTSWI